jgi:hypothetical protein
LLKLSKTSIISITGRWEMLGANDTTFYVTSIFRNYDLSGLSS